MCGIAGFFNSRQYNENDLKRMTTALAHRGPDGFDYFVDASLGLGLGHRRLAILDLSNDARQPMTYEDSGLWLCFNGEVYNFIELKEELQGLGYRFRTHSDSEV